MSSKRSYRQFCGLAKALDLIGERWTLLIVRNLLLGPLRYSELLRGLPGITTNLLAKRLKELEVAGLIERLRSGPGVDVAAYRLTSLGHGLEPAVHALGRWGWRAMTQPGAREHRSLEWLLVALRRRYRGGLSLSVELVADGVLYSMALTPTRAAIGRGGSTEPDLRIRGPAIKIAELFLGQARGSREVEVEGERKRMAELLAGFATHD